MPCLREEGGNVLWYILVAVVLFGALNYAVSGMNRGGTAQVQKMQEDQAGMLAEQLISEASGIDKSFYNARSWVDDFYTELLWLRPGDSGFDTGSHAFKVYHNDGIGVQTFLSDGTTTTTPGKIPEEATDTGITNLQGPGWYRFTWNFDDWAPDTDGDGVYNVFTAQAYGLAEPTCAAINEAITGDPTIPEYSVTGGNDAADCTPDLCTDKYSLCVRDTTRTQDAYTYFTVLWDESVSTP